MRVLLIGLNYAPEIVGIGPYNTQLAEHLAAAGHKVSVLTTFPYYPFWKIDARYRRRGPFLTEDVNGVRIVRSPVLLPGLHQGAFRRVVFDSSLAVTALIASAGVGAVDTVICVSPPLQLGITAWIVARLRRARLILHLQDLVPDAALSLGILHEGKAAGIARRVEHFVYAHADRITVMSQSFLDNLLAKGVTNEKLRLLPNWVDTDLFTIAQDASVRATLGAADSETLVVHAGNMGAKQGLETVIDAAAQLVGEGFVVALIGDGNRRAELQARAGHLGLTNVRFLELQSDFPATLAAADVLVVSQRSGIVDSVAPSKLLGYMASGTLIVAAVNDRSEAGRMIRLAECGVVVPPGDPNALAVALRDIRQRPEDYSRLGDAGRQFVAKYYERSSVLTQWSSLIDE